MALDVAFMGEKQSELNDLGWYYNGNPEGIPPEVSDTFVKLIEFSFGLYGQACRNKERIDDLEWKLETALETIEALRKALSEDSKLVMSEEPLKYAKPKKKRHEMFGPHNFSNQGRPGPEIYPEEEENKP